MPCRGDRFFCVTKFLTQDNPKHYGGLKKAQITPQLKLSPCKPNLRCRNTIVQSRRTDPKGSTSHNIDASPEGFSEGFPVDDVIRFGASPSARGWRKGQWRKGRWGGAGAGQMAPSGGAGTAANFLSAWLGRAPSSFLSSFWLLPCVSSSGTTWTRNGVLAASHCCCCRKIDLLRVAGKL